jgi:DNA replication protein DnaC
MRDRSHDVPQRADFFSAIAEEAKAFAPSDEEARKAEQRLDMQQREPRLDESGIRGSITEEDFRAICAGSLQDTHALRTVQRWVNARSSGSTRPLSTLVLVGLTGRGKTVAGAWLLAKLGGRYITAEALRRVVVGSHWRDAATLVDLLNTRCVVVDDAGGEHEANGAKAAMFELVNKRVGHGSAWTLITANLTAAEFAERYGERTIRRIEHQGAIVEVSGDDLRRGQL